MIKLTREEIALRLLCAVIEKDGAQGEKQIREVFALTSVFEKVSDEVGGRPITSGVKRRRPNGDEEEDD